MSARTRLIALIAAGALLVGCGSTTAGTGVLGSVAGAPPVASDQPAPQESTEEPADPADPDTTTEEPPAAEPTQEAPPVEEPSVEEPPVEEPGDADVPALPGNLDACMNVGMAFASISLSFLMTDSAELDQVLVDIDTALAAAPEEIKPALQTLADLSRSAQGKSIEEWSAVFGSPEYTAASDEVSAWLETACAG